MGDKADHRHMVTIVNNFYRFKLLKVKRGNEGHVTN